MNARIFLVAAIAFVSGCGQLRVKVDVINPAYLDNEAREPVLYKTLEASLSVNIENILEEQRKVHIAYYQNLAKSYSDRASALASGNPRAAQVLSAAAGGLSALTPQVNTLYEQANKRFVSLRSQISITLGAFPEQQRKDILDRRQPIRGDLAGLLEEWRFSWLQFSRIVQDELGEQRKTLKNSGLEPAIQRALEAGGKTVSDHAKASEKTATGGGKSVLEDPSAYAVSAAPEGMWAQNFNQAMGKGLFGNTDIAVKMNGPGDFTVKGLLFDPGKVAEVASKSVTQALVVAAQVAGVPINLSSPSGAGQSLAMSSASLAQAEGGAADRGAAIKSSRKALFDIADAIVRERAEIADDTRRNAAIDALRNTFESHKNRITPKTPANQ